MRELVVRNTKRNVPLFPIYPIIWLQKQSNISSRHPQKNDKHPIVTFNLFAYDPTLSLKIVATRVAKKR
jgi:hypothetical protein